MRDQIMKTAGVLFIIFMFGLNLQAQTEVMAWGNLTGIRVEGELMEFESSFRVVDSGWKSIDYTGRERQTTMYTREGNAHVVKSSVRGVNFEQRVEDSGPGATAVSLTYGYNSNNERKSEGAYYAITLPAKRYSGGSVRAGDTSVTLGAPDADKKLSGKQISISGKGRVIRLDFPNEVAAFTRGEQGDAVATIYIRLLEGDLKKGQSGALNFTITASGDIDREPVEITVDKNNPGRLFAGLGGNFRLQNPTMDPQVIDYNLQNMRVAFGRVEMPWRMWQPQEDSDPIAAAREGKLNAQVEKSMQMARRLAAMDMPVIVSAWFPPGWALQGNTNMFRGGGVAALRLDPAKTLKIYKSIADYLVYLKQEYGVEAYAFSFNESDIGIDVLHTPEEHAAFIKGLGKELAYRGLATGMLLGDNSDATTFDFILPAIADPETHPYITAVSFHSWRGCDDATLRKWAGAAQQLNVPLLVGEGSTDAAAWRYPQIFLESTFALYEINLYVRIAAISQPLSILQWQLTSDYSLLWGAGIFQSDGELRPTQRFWNLKQLAATPERAFALPFTGNKDMVNCAVFGNLSRNEYAVHMVNNGAARKAIVNGLPDGLSDLKAYATAADMGMREIPAARNADGSLSVDLPPVSFVTLLVK